MAIVLLVDDHQDGRQMYADSLTRVLEAANLDDAVAQAPHADIIVTDLALPSRFDGITLIERVRADPITRGMPVIVVTAYDQELGRRRAIDAGCDSFLVKPCLPDTLLAHIQSLLKQQPAGPDVSSR